MGASNLQKSITIETNRIKHEVSNLVVVLKNNDIQQAKILDLEEGTYFSIPVWTHEVWHAYVENKCKYRAEK